MANINEVKTYSSKSNCKRAAIKAAVKHFAITEAKVKEDEGVCFTVTGNKADGFVFTLAQPEPVEVVVTKPINVKAIQLVGVSIVEKPVNPACVVGAVITTTTRVRKIQKVRLSQNGVTRPTSGGKCARIWDICDEKAANYADKRVPFSIIRTVAEAEGLSLGNARAEYAAWRKFNAITGRIVEPKA